MKRADQILIRGRKKSRSGYRGMVKRIRGRRNVEEKSKNEGGGGEDEKEVGMKMMEKK